MDRIIHRTQATYLDKAFLNGSKFIPLSDQNNLIIECQPTVVSDFMSGDDEAQMLIVRQQDNLIIIHRIALSNVCCYHPVYVYCYHPVYPD